MRGIQDPTNILPEQGVVALMVIAVCGLGYNY